MPALQAEIAVAVSWCQPLFSRLDIELPGWLNHESYESCKICFHYVFLDPFDQVREIQCYRVSWVLL